MRNILPLLMLPEAWSKNTSSNKNNKSGRPATRFSTIGFAGTTMGSPPSHYYPCGARAGAKFVIARSYYEGRSISPDAACIYDTTPFNQSSSLLTRPHLEEEEAGGVGKIAIMAGCGITHQRETQQLFMTDKPINHLYEKIYIWLCGFSHRGFCRL